MLDGFYKNKRVLVTGHTGFKGSWLVKWLAMQGADVSGYSLPPNQKPDLFSALKISSLLKNNKFGDIRNSADLKLYIEKVQPEIVFHLAAQPLVRLSYDDPHCTHETNIMGLVNLLDIVRAVKSVKSVVVITTDKVYANKEWIWPYRESDELGGYDPYSASKACVEIITKSYRESFFNPLLFGQKHNTLIATVRAGNVIGGGDWSTDRLIPDIIRATFESKSTLSIRSPNAIRPWQFVLSPLYGYLLVGKLLYEGKTSVADSWNFGPDESGCLTVRQIADTAKNYLGTLHVEYSVTDGKHETTLLSLDSTKARTLLNWSPPLGIKDSLQYTYEWYKKYYDGDNVVEFTEQIIREFEKNVIK